MWGPLTGAGGASGALALAYPLRRDCLSDTGITLQTEGEWWI